jgi:hypothetical protein
VLRKSWKFFFIKHVVKLGIEPSPAPVKGEWCYYFATEAPCVSRMLLNDRKTLNWTNLEDKE